MDQQKGTFRKARTLLDLQHLSAELGDELARQLANNYLAERAGGAAQVLKHVCPQCGQRCAVEAGREPLILRGLRGKIEYSEPSCHCRTCRREFFTSDA